MEGFRRCMYMPRKRCRLRKTSSFLRVIFSTKTTIIAITTTEWQKKHILEKGGNLISSTLNKIILWTKYEQNHTLWTKYEQKHFGQSIQREQSMARWKEECKPTEAMSEKGHTAHLLDKDLNCPKYAKRTSMGQVKETMHEHNAAINRDGLLLQVNPAHCPRRTDKGRDYSLLCRAEKVWEHCKLICKVQRGFILVLYFRIQNQEKKNLML